MNDETKENCTRRTQPKNARKESQHKINKKDHTKHSQEGPPHINKKDQTKSTQERPTPEKTQEI